jgi:replicative DNA helicase
MATFDSNNIVKLTQEPGAPAFRTAPHNIEAEQSVLGAMLVNNDAFYRVSDFLKPDHFFEPIHQTIYDTASSIIRAGKVATPVTLKTFLPADTDLGGMTVGQYLARLAAEATTIINTHDYGRTIYELAIRRQLINVGEDMVNVAYDAPVDFAPRAQIEDAERRLYELAEAGRYDGGDEDRAGHGGQRLSPRRQAVGHFDRHEGPRCPPRRVAGVRSRGAGRTSRHGQDRARH